MNFKFEFTVNIPSLDKWLNAEAGKSDQILGLLQQMQIQVKQVKDEDTIMAKSLADLQQDVTAEGTVIEGAVTLLQGLSAQIADLKTKITDPDAQAEIDALAASIEGQTAVLAGALVANTPAAATETSQPDAGQVDNSQPTA
jgi:hypothetical protein